VIWRADHDRHAIGLDGWEKMLAHPLGEFLLGPLSTPKGRLYRSWRAGQAKHAGVLEDYADVANGLYELHVATGELRWLEEARRLAVLAVDLFGDPADGALAAIEMYPDDNVDPCEVYFSDYQEAGGRFLPRRMEVRYGNKVFGVFMLTDFDLQKSAEKSP
jgi:hypothetical protein